MTDTQFPSAEQYRFVLPVHDRSRIRQSVMQKMFPGESVMYLSTRLNYLYLIDGDTDMHLVSLEHLASLFYRLIKRLNLYARRIRTRRQLFDLDDYALEDLGLTRQQALEEARRYFWQGNDELAGDDGVSQSEPETRPLIVKSAYPAGNDQPGIS